MPRESSYNSTNTLASSGHSRRRNQPVQIDPAVPIDVEVIEDDDVIILPPPRPRTGLAPSRPRSQASSSSRRRRPAVVCIDDDVEEIPVRQSEDELSIVSGSNHNKRVRITPNTGTSNWVRSTRQSKSRTRSKEPEVVQAVPVEVVPPKEPTFSCPVCLNQLTEPCSTICGHVFCSSCIKASIQAQKKCPTCRRKLNKNNFHRVYFPNTTTN